jgi:hypothetical protein
METRTILLIIGSGLFGIGTWMATHHSHQVVNATAGERAKEFIVYSIVGVGLVTIGSNILTDVATEHIAGW